MKQTLTIISQCVLLFLLLTQHVNAQYNPAATDAERITIKTNKEPGESLLLYVYAGTNNLWIDLNGDATYQEGEEITLLADASFVIKQQEMTIYGPVSRLNCPKNKLTEIDLSYASELGYIDCGDNELTTLDVSKAVKLYGLECYNNKIASLDLSNNPELDWISCFCNGINDSAMTALIESLPIPTAPTAVLKPYTTLPWGEVEETNVCTPEHVALAKNKNWTPLDADGLPFGGITSLQDLVNDNTKIKYTSADGMLKLMGLTAAVPVEIYALDGSKLYEATAVASEMSIQLTRGCYILRVGNYYSKLLQR